MANGWNFCTSGEAIARAGAGAASAITGSGATLQIYSSGAEAYICSFVGKNLIGNYSTLTSNGRQILGDTASRLIANDIIMYDTSGYFKVREAETILDLNDDKIRENMSVLKDNDKKAYLGIT